jgi:hypothetical protein
MQTEQLVVTENKKDEDLGKVRGFIERVLTEKVSGPEKKEKPKTQQGFRVFDETELMVEKPAEQIKEAQVDTVLVTYHKPNSDEVRYHLSYRVANYTKSKQLREDACNYWNLSEVEYILLTQEYSKVHDELTLPHCFRPDESCRLILAPKDPTRTALLPSEFEATRPKNQARKKKAQAVTEDATKKGSTMSFYDWMQTKPGLWDFMTQRDQNVVDHLTRIKLSSIVVLILVIVLTLLSLNIVQPPLKLYYMRYGPLKILTANHRSTMVNAANVTVPVSAPTYENIKTSEQAWQWLTYTVPHQLMDANSDLRRHNFVVGKLRLRMQQVTEPAESVCKPEGMVPGGTLCYHRDYTSKTAGKEELIELRSYWEGGMNTTTTTSTTTTTTLTTTSTTTSQTTLTEAPPTTATTPASTTTLSTLSPVDPLALKCSQFLSQRIASNVFGRSAWLQDTFNLTDPMNHDTSLGQYLDLAELCMPFRNHLGGIDGRKRVHPWKFLDAEVNVKDNNAEPLRGRTQSYDASGYNIDYDLQFSNLDAMKAAYRLDMVALQDRGWRTSRTRLIAVEFTVYGVNYDLWVNCQFLLEMRATSVTIPTKHLNVYMASTKDIQGGPQLFWMDTARVALCALGSIWQIYYEIRTCRRRDPPESVLRSYILTPFFLCDICIVIFSIVIYVIRDLIFNLSLKSKDFLMDLMKEKFVSTALRAAAHKIHIGLEAILIGAVLYRLLSYSRMNRNFFIVWTTMWDSAKLFLPFLLVLIPILLGFTVWAHTIWHFEDKTFQTFADTFISVIMMALGDVDRERMFKPTRPVTLVFGLFFYITIFFFLINAWIAVLVHVYQGVRVKAGFRPKDYKWKEMHYVNWMLWTPVARTYFTRLRPRIERPKAFANVDDDDDDK